MIIKKIGYHLLIRAQLFHLLTKLAPIAIVFSFALLYFTLPLKEGYEFQEPSLRTKVFEVNQTNSAGSLPYLDIGGGIRGLFINGRLPNQCLLVTIHKDLEHSREVRTIFNSFAYSQIPSKNIAILSYQQIQQLQQFLQFYHDPKKNTDFSFGIIRASLNLNIDHSSASRSSKEKAYFQLYSGQSHADLDYFQAVKQLLQANHVVWSPCQAIHKSGVLKTFKQGLLSISRSSGMRHLIEQLLCQFSQFATMRLSAHQAMAQYGFQSGSLLFVSNSTSMTVPKVVVSFVYQFAFQEDHLHSSQTLYYPLSKDYQMPLLSFLYPGLLYLVGTVVTLISIFVKQPVSHSLQISDLHIGLMAFCLSQFSIRRKFQLTIACNLLLVAYNIVFGKKRSGYDSMNYLDLGLVALMSMMDLYYSVFAHSLFYISSVFGLFMFTRPLWNRFMVFRVINLALSTALLWLMWDSRPQLQLLLVIYLFYCSL